MGIALLCAMIYSGGGTTGAEDAQETPTQSHISPSILVCEDVWALLREQRDSARAAWCPFFMLDMTAILVDVTVIRMDTSEVTMVK